MLAASLIAATIALVPNPNAKLPDVLPYARSVWHDAPCAQIANVALVDEVLAPGEAPVIGFGFVDYYKVGMAWPAECRAVVLSDLRGVELCAAVVHELGHLALQTLNHRSYGIMRENAPLTTPGCERRFGEPKPKVKRKTRRRARP